VQFKKKKKTYSDKGTYYQISKKKTTVEKAPREACSRADSLRTPVAKTLLSRVTNQENIDLLPRGEQNALLGKPNREGVKSAVKTRGKA